MIGTKKISLSSLNLLPYHIHLGASQENGGQTTEAVPSTWVFMDIVDQI